MYNMMMMNEGIANESPPSHPTLTSSSSSVSLETGFGASGLLIPFFFFLNKDFTSLMMMIDDNRVCGGMMDK